MPIFLWSGRSISGKEEAVEIEAETALDAKRILEAGGWTHLRQHTDKVSDFIQKQSRASHPERPTLTAKENLQYRMGATPGFWREWIKSLGQSSAVILLMAVLIYLRTRSRFTPISNERLAIYVTGPVVVIFLYPIWRWWLGRTKRLFVQLTVAKNWHRWEEVLQCADKLAALKRASSGGINDYSLAQYRAQAMAGLGRLDEALTDYADASEKARPPKWLYHVTRASIYRAAKQYDQVLKCYYDALSEEPDNSTVCLDAGKLMVQRFDFPAKAKELLARAKKEQLSELERVHVPLLKGMIAFREKDYPALAENMREALIGFEQRAATKFYIFEPSLLTCKGYLAVGSAGLGRKDEARKYFAESEKYLRAMEYEDLLKDYEGLMGQAQSSELQPA